MDLNAQDFSVSYWNQSTHTRFGHNKHLNYTNSATSGYGTSSSNYTDGVTSGYGTEPLNYTVGAATEYETCRLMPQGDWTSTPHHEGARNSNTTTHETNSDAISFCNMHNTRNVPLQYDHYTSRPIDDWSYPMQTQPIYNSMSTTNQHALEDTVIDLSSRPIDLSMPSTSFGRSSRHLRGHRLSETPTVCTYENCGLSGAATLGQQQQRQSQNVQINKLGPFNIGRGDIYKTCRQSGRNLDPDAYFGSASNYRNHEQGQPMSKSVHEMSPSPYVAQRGPCITDSRLSTDTERLSPAADGIECTSINSNCYGYETHSGPERVSMNASSSTIAPYNTSTYGYDHHLENYHLRAEKYGPTLGQSRPYGTNRYPSPRRYRQYYHPYDRRNELQYSMERRHDTMFQFIDAMKMPGVEIQPIDTIGRATACRPAYIHNTHSSKHEVYHTRVYHENEHHPPLGRHGLSKHSIDVGSTTACHSTPSYLCKQTYEDGLHIPNASFTKEEKETLYKEVKQELFGKILTTMENEVQCSICQEIIIKAISLGCSHNVCSLCFKQLVKFKVGSTNSSACRRGITCPLCRSKVKQPSRCIGLDNFIDAMFDDMPDTQKKERKELKEARNEAEETFDTENHKLDLSDFNRSAEDDDYYDSDFNDHIEMDDDDWGFDPPFSDESDIYDSDERDIDLDDDDDDDDDDGTGGEGHDNEEVIGAFNDNESRDGSSTNDGRNDNRNDVNVLNNAMVTQDQEADIESRDSPLNVSGIDTDTDGLVELMLADDDFDII